MQISCNYSSVAVSTSLVYCTLTETSHTCYLPTLLGTPDERVLARWPKGTLTMECDTMLEFLFRNCNNMAYFWCREGRNHPTSWKFCTNKMQVIMDVRVHKYCCWTCWHIDFSASLFPQPPSVPTQVQLNPPACQALEEVGLSLSLSL